MLNERSWESEDEVNGHNIRKKVADFGLEKNSLPMKTVISSSTLHEMLGC